MNLQFKVAIFEPRHQHGIIEVTRGFAVDGHNRKIAKVAPLAELRRRNDRLNGCGLIEHFFGKPVWKVMFADDDFDIDAEVIFVSENLDDSAAWLLSCRRPVGD